MNQTKETQMNECYCENTLCDSCQANGCPNNSNPLTHIKYMGKGGVCDDCATQMPQKYHLGSCCCPSCVFKIEVIGVTLGIYLNEFRQQLCETQMKQLRHEPIDDTEVCELVVERNCDVFNSWAEFWV